MTRFANAARAVFCMMCLVGTVAQAAPATYQFSVAVTDGPLAGRSSTGTFTFDSSIIVPNDSVSQTGLFTDVSFVWDGIPWDETTVDSSFLGFNPDGTLYGALFGTNCGPSGFGCGLNADPLPLSQWFFGISDGVGIFDYVSMLKDPNPYYTYQVSMSQVPVPGTGALVPLALGLMWGPRRGVPRRAS